MIRVSPSKPISYKIRNKFHVVEGTLTAKEILKKIRAGKLTGEEEISPPPYERWQKLASHSEFYDAFLKRLYDKNYQSPDGDAEAEEEDSRRGKSSSERATRQGQAHKTRIGKDEKEEGGKTHRIGEDQPFGATIHQSVIDELFDDGSRKSGAGVSPEELASAGTDLIKVEPAPMESSLPPDIEKTRRLDFSADSKPPESPLPEAKALGTKDKRRRLILVGALTVGLVLLFQMGLGPAQGEKDFLTGNDKEPSREIITKKELREEKLKSLVDEGDGLAGLDTVLGYRAALDVYRSALRIDDAGNAVLGRLALAAARLLPDSDNPEALIAEIRSNIQRGRATDPHQSAYYRAEAFIAIYEDKPVEARRFVLNATEADPISGENHLATAEILLRQGELGPARASAEEAVKALPGSVRVRSTMAQVAFEQRDLARARAEALEALKLNPLHPNAYLILADTVALQNQLKEARGLYETCGRLAKFASKRVAASAYYRLAMLQEGAGIEELAKRNYRLAYHYEKDLDGLGAKVKGLNVDEVSLKPLAAEAEYGKDYFQMQGDGLLRQKKYREAVRFFQAAQLADPNDGLALIRLGEVIEKTAGSYDDFRKVMNLYQRAIDKDPKQPLGYIRLGMLETEQYNIDHAHQLLTQAVALAPNDSAPYVALGKHHYKRQDYTEALNQFLKAAKINPSDSEISYYAGLLRLLFKKEGIKDAPKFFYQAYSLDPQNYDALVEWLKLKVMSYEKNFAIKFVRNLMEADPNNASLYWAMGEVYGANKEFRRAIQYFHKSLDLENRSSKVRMSLARTLESVGELEKAVAEFRLASLLDRRNSEGFYRAADLLFQMKRYNESEEVLKYLINVTPSYPGAHRYLSKIHQVRKQKDLAIAAMKEEVTLNPHNPKFRLEFAELYMEYETYDLAIAQLTEVTNLPSITKAPEYVFDKTRAYLLLSRCYRAQGKPDSAEGPIKLALEIDGNDPELHRELGYVYYAQQRDKEGVRAFETYLNRNPAARDAAAIKSLIQQMMIEE